jgi:hypothetical protein
MIKKIIRSYIRNPVLILLFLVFYLVLVLITKIPALPSPSPIFDYVFLIIPRILLLAVYTAFFSVFIGSAFLALKKKVSLKESVSFIRASPGNFLLFLPLVLINTVLIVAISYIRWNLPNFYVIQAVAEIILFILLANLLIMSFFFHTIKKENVFNSIKNSIKKTPKIYLILLLIQVIYFIATIPVSFLPKIAQDIIYFLVIYPIITLTLASLFENVQSK